MTTLTSARTDLLNVALGLTADSDDRFGTTAVRNLALQDGCRRLWPEMALELEETVTITADTIDYTLTSVRDPARIELTGSSAVWFSDAGKDFTWWYDEDSSATRLRLPQAFSTELTLTVHGYKPYATPAAGGDSFDVPDDQLYVVVDGAISYLYRVLMHQFVTFERHENENRRTALGTQEMVALYREAEARYQQGRMAHRRRNVVPKRAVRAR